jgi:hypothetical protein
MSNLIPERRTDKRGNVVTRWVKSLTDQKLRKPVPAPVFSLVDHVKLEAIETFMTQLFPYKDERHGKDLRPNVEFLRENVPYLVARITDGDVSVEELGYWRGYLQGQKLNAHTPEEYDEVVERYRRKQELLPVVARLTNTIEDNKWIGTAYLRKFVGAAERLSEQMPAEEWDSKFEALTTACFLTESHVGEWKEKEVELKGLTYADMSSKVEYILSHREEVDEVMPELLKRGSCDLQIIKDMAESPARAIMEGEL